MRDTDKTRRHYAEVAANWINTCDGATLLELKRHTQDPRSGCTPFYNWAIRDARGDLMDIDEAVFLDLIGAPNKYYTLRDRLFDAGLTVYDHGDGGLTILNKRNPLLQK